MNISNISVGLKGDDLLSIYNDFVSIKELNIEKIEVKDDIKIIGSFIKGIVIKFECKVKLNSMKDGLINGEVTGFRILNIGIASFLRKIALKFALKELSDKGISYDNGKVIIQYKYLLKDIPYVDFDINNIYCMDNILNIELRNIKASLGGELKKEVELLSFEKEVILCSIFYSSYQEIADILGVSETAVRSAISRARRKIKDQLDEPDL